MMSNRFRTAGFRFTLLTASIFSICLLMLGSLIFFDVRDSLERQLRQRIEAEQAQLMGDYTQDGLEELRHDIRERIEANPTGRLLYFVQSPTGKVIFDKIPSLPDQQGWSYYQNGKQSILLYTVSLKDGYWLGIAADRREVKDGEQAVLHAAGIALSAMLVLSLVAGAVISHLFMRQIDKVAQAAKEIGEGNLMRRLPVTGSQDDLDQLAVIINTMLDRIQSLVENLQHVSANIAHDLRTPLGHVRQKLEDLQSSVSQDQAEHVHEAVTRLDYVMDTFAALLRIAEIESGTRKSAFTQVDFSDLLHHLVDTFGPVAEEAGQTIDATITPHVSLWADKDLIIQVCVNLIENAIRYAGAGARVQIELARHADHVMFSVSDNGTGVTPEMLDHLTTRFYRVDKSRTSRGNGLGLNLVKAIADLHGMTLTLHDNQPGLRVTLGMKTDH